VINHIIIKKQKENGMELIKFYGNYD